MRVCACVCVGKCSLSLSRTHHVSSVDVDALADALLYLRLPLHHSIGPQLVFSLPRGVCGGE